MNRARTSCGTAEAAELAPPDRPPRAAERVSHAGSSSEREPEAGEQQAPALKKRYSRSLPRATTSEEAKRADATEHAAAAL